jgi:hypothetical protein
MTDNGEIDLDSVLSALGNNRNNRSNDNANPDPNPDVNQSNANTVRPDDQSRDLPAIVPARFDKIEVLSETSKNVGKWLNLVRFTVGPLRLTRVLNSSILARNLIARSTMNGTTGLQLWQDGCGSTCLMVYKTEWKLPLAKPVTICLKTTLMNLCLRMMLSVRYEGT